MGKTKPLGRGLAALAGTPVLSTEDAARGDDTGAALGNEQRRYERAVLDFEAQVYRHGTPCVPSTMKICARF